MLPTHLVFALCVLLPHKILAPNAIYGKPITAVPTAPSNPNTGREAEGTREAPAVDTSTAPSPSDDSSPSTFEGELSAGQILATIFGAIAAVQTRSWEMLTAAVIMLLVFALDMFWVRRLPDDKRRNIMPWLSICIAVVIQFATTLAAGTGWLQALNVSLVTGTSASGLWSLVGKQLVGRLAPAEAAANPNRLTTALPPENQPPQPVAPLPVSAATTEPPAA